MIECPGLFIQEGHGAGSRTRGTGEEIAGQASDHYYRLHALDYGY